MCFDFDQESACPPQHSLSYAFDDGGHDVYICIASKRGTRAARMNSQKFSFGKPPCVFENQFRLRLAHRMHLDFQNLIKICQSSPVRNLADGQYGIWETEMLNSKLVHRFEFELWISLGFILF